MKLIVNADDFGLTVKVNEAICKALDAGIVKSTTLMMNQPATNHAIRLIKEKKLQDVGLHLVFTSGRPITPISQVPDLVDDAGMFLDKSVLMAKETLPQDQLLTEFRAQYHAALEAGVDINHIDGHHFANAYPALKQTFIKFANEVQLPVRRIDTVRGGQGLLNVVTPDVFDISFYDDGVRMDKFKAELLHYKRQYPDGIVEFMCHPGRPDDEQLKMLSSYTTKRFHELRILTDCDFLEWLIDNGIEPVGYNIFNGK
ncbi:carbohydrate deacetylase [Vibrio panuliri]|uniref:PTS cellbiose transporter n=1 Tax=Vibrio panuliri TaxID=1381081 RepID=A0ABX3FGL4_9VIBR|nr:carbohydrate deacetylase [Vibrio panuliri]KAB1460866.1 carbohydrate deacetylase [Vibrio panuliri]OLQ91671.1 PTS cellbiose transporter [Vibrio panuliri]